MTGYKGMTKDMTCRGMKFEIGKTYHVDGKISLCKNGLHFCKRLIDVMNFYDINDGSRYFKVEADGVVKSDGIKSVASSLTILREINGIELYRIIYGCGCGYGDGYSYGNGNGYGNSNGYGNGNGYGNSNGYGYGDGYSNGNGHGNSYSNGNGHGNGNGYGYSNGNGYGSSNGYSYGFDNIQKIIKYV